MCGIVGCVGKIDTTKFLFDGLKALDYRGYDSAGMAFAVNNEIKVYRAIGLIENLEKVVPTGIKSNIGIGHTRWATHGKVTLENCHPVVSNSGLVTIVHNGMIENFNEIKQELTQRGFTTYSETDTELIANLLERAYGTHEGNPLLAVRHVLRKLKGTFACGIIFNTDLNAIYFMKKGSPLIIGKGKGFNLLASDATPMVDYTKSVYSLNDDEYGFITKDTVQVYDGFRRPVQVEFEDIDPELMNKNLGKYNHFMEKETDEIVPVLQRIISNVDEFGNFKIDPNLVKDMRAADHITFVACGTSYHASLFGRRLLREHGKGASSHIASEWIYYPEISGKKPFIVMLSQSGETGDMIHALKIAKANNIKTLVICNNKGSTLDRECDYSVLLNCGVEISVASTKAYSAQCTMLGLIISSLYDSSQDFIAEMENIIPIITNVKENMKGKILKIAKSIKNANNMFFLGRGNGYDLSLEASLKCKEVSYIHSEAYAGGELKHGPISLIDDNYPVVAFVSDPLTADALRNNVQQTRTRGAKIIIITTKTLARPGDSIVLDDFDPTMTCIVMAPVAFYLAYYLAILRGYNPDKPRNLAKSVTVE